MKFFRRKEVPWEVVGHKAVEPIPMYDEDDELDVVFISDSCMSMKFEHDIESTKDMRNAIKTARYMLMQHLVLRNYNTMLLEGWRITILRKGKKHRAEVVYTGRPAYAIGKLNHSTPPPFLDVLEFYRNDMCSQV